VAKLAELTRENDKLSEEIAKEGEETTDESTKMKERGVIDLGIIHALRYFDGKKMI